MLHRSLLRVLSLLCLLPAGFSSLYAQKSVPKIAIPAGATANNNAISNAGASQANDKNFDAAMLTNRISAASLQFAENNGQVADVKGKPQPGVLFTAHSGGAQLFLTANGISYQFSRAFISKAAKEKQVAAKFKYKATDSTQLYRLDVQLAGADPQPDIVKENERTGTENFYLAHCPTGITGVKSYSRIVYKNVYPHIDWIIYSKGKSLKYDFVVNPGGNVANIKLRYNGAEKISLNEKGAVTISSPLGTVSEQQPVSFQQGGKAIASKFIVEKNTLSFEIKDWNKSLPLTIDPEVVWATYYGGAGNEAGYSCTADAAGNVYLAGITTSGAGIASAGFQTKEGGDYDAFLVKFDAAGNRLWATYYGGKDADYGNACTTDAAGNVYLTGSTNSVSGIASNGFQNTTGGVQDAFLVKFSASGLRLWATYYGGKNLDYGNACTTDATGNIYIAGTTSSGIGIAFNGFKNKTDDYGDAFLVKFDAAGNRLWATYYGGDSLEEGRACATDRSGNVYLTGETVSANGIASGGFQNTKGGDYDAFLVKFDAAGNRLWATYYGGESFDRAYSCATDGSGNVYMASQTFSNTGIAFNGFQNTMGGDQDAFLVKFDASGSRLWATYYGGDGIDAGLLCAADSAGSVYMAGDTYSANGIASGGFQNNYGGGEDAFLVKFTASGARAWATYYGGNVMDYGTSCATGSGGNIYLAGDTYTHSGLASNGFQDTLGGGETDAFLVKISDRGVLPLRLLSFDALLQNKLVNLTWQTAQEINSALFIVEKSSDGITYYPVQDVPVSSSNNHIYTATDKSPFTGNSLYRLKMVDKDGAFSYSAAIPVVFMLKSLIVVSPNPATDKLTVQLQNGNSATASLQLTDVNGRIFYTKQLMVTAGVNTFYIPVSAFANGPYLLTVLQGTDKQTIKWIKK